MSVAAERIWLKSYPPGIPADIDYQPFSSIVELFEQSVAMYAARNAYCFMGKTMTYAELEADSCKLAAYLQSLGLEKGARIAIMMPNCFQYPLALFAILRAGYTVVNVNPLYTPRELEHQLKDSGAQAIFILENFAATLQQVIDKTSVKHVVMSALGDRLGLKGFIVNLVVRHVKKLVPAWSLPGHMPFNKALAQGERCAFSKPALTLDDVAFLQYTGGTTGVSKGATLTHKNIVANILQSEAWYMPALKRIPAGEQVVKVTALPLYHIFALTACCLLGLRIGAMNLLIANPRDFAKFIHDLSNCPPHVFPAVNTLFNALMHHPDFDKVNWKKLILAVGGGMAVQESVAAQWLERTGCTICQGYGLSETSPIVTCNPTDTREFSGAIGLPLSNTEVSIRDDEGKSMSIGERGEICIRGPQVMVGYWQRPEETAQVMTEDGYFRTGDIGIMDERGYIRIVDRKKDMILVSGFNVYPNEVEEVIAGHPGVLEVAAVGVPDEYSGEAVKVFVVRKNQSLTEEDLRTYCTQNLTGYKRPKFFEFRDELPKTNVGKILRRVLRDEALKKTM
jgi:long-chain acyl-CoA synthetase